MNADTMNAAALAAYEIEKARLAAKGLRIPIDDEAVAQNLFCLGFCAGAQFTLDEIKAPQP